MISRDTQIDCIKISDAAKYHTNNSFELKGCEVAVLLRLK